MISSSPIWEWQGIASAAGATTEFASLRAESIKPSSGCTGVSRIQAAFAVVLQEQLPGLTDPLQVFDPVFTANDNELLHQMGMEASIICS